jgi:hypothetical protein
MLDKHSLKRSLTIVGLLTLVESNKINMFGPILQMHFTYIVLKPSSDNLRACCAAVQQIENRTILGKLLTSIPKQ